jgi:hypothetical protein
MIIHPEIHLQIYSCQPQADNCQALRCPSLTWTNVILGQSHHSLTSNKIW